ncbi:MAG: ABC transporter ATP-binding protein [Limnochordia bacterium]|jgi:ABC-2 type transport system ATP-binding protein|nr:ABC transporter ATP-binding protein [Bacillota bacterium]
MIQVESLQKTYPGRKGQPACRAVDSITFSVPKGQLLGLLGPNGAGKTTTVKMLCGLILPDTGRIFVNGKELTRSRIAALADISAVLEGNRNMYWRLTPRENLEFFAALKGINPAKIRGEINHYLERFRLAEKSDVEARKLSRGMQQKLAILVALISQSKVILLDEPTLGLDVQASHEIRQLLKEIVAEQGRTVILTTHDMNVVQDTCERVIIVNQGRVVADDSVHNLLDLFKVRVYKVTIAGELTGEQRASLLSMEEVLIQEELPHQTVVSVRLEKSEVLYEVIGILGSNNSVIESIDQEQNNFERVFLEIVEGGAQVV